MKVQHGLLWISFAAAVTILATAGDAAKDEESSVVEQQQQQPSNFLLRGGSAGAAGVAGVAAATSSTNFDKERSSIALDMDHFLDVDHVDLHEQALLLQAEEQEGGQGGEDPVAVVHSAPLVKQEEGRTTGRDRALQTGVALGGKCSDTNVCQSGLFCVSPGGDLTGESFCYDGSVGSFCNAAEHCKATSAFCSIDFSDAWYRKKCTQGIKGDSCAATFAGAGTPSGCAVGFYCVRPGGDITRWFCYDGSAGSFCTSAEQCNPTTAPICGVDYSDDWQRMKCNQGVALGGQCSTSAPCLSGLFCVQDSWGTGLCYDGSAGSFCHTNEDCNPTTSPFCSVDYRDGHYKCTEGKKGDSCGGTHGESGYRPNVFNGWYDIDDQTDTCHAYCRWVGNTPPPADLDPGLSTPSKYGSSFWACQTSSSIEYKLVNATVEKTKCPFPVKDAGYKNIHTGWYDINNDGKCEEYCRWVGDTAVPNDLDPRSYADYNFTFSGSFWACHTSNKTYEQQFADQTFSTMKCKSGTLRVGECGPVADCNKPKP